jgi:UDPglucose 6-dehydrogenase
LVLRRRSGEAVAANAKLPFHLCSNPEFLKEGAALDDFMKPDRVVLGVESDQARSVMAELYAPFVRTGKPIIFMDIPSAEMTKYAANAMLATRISFMNEIAALCERVGANVDLVRKGVGSDARIGPSFLFPGPGYGGSCFPKDVKALVSTGAPVRSAAAGARSRGKRERPPEEAPLREAVRRTRWQPLRAPVLPVWDCRSSLTRTTCASRHHSRSSSRCSPAGGSVVAHDPAAMEEARRRLGDTISFAATNYEALTGADALVIVTDWNEYRHP